MNLDPIIRACQVAAGCRVVDGKAGPDTWQRIHAKLAGKPFVPPEIATVMTGDEADPRSEKNIATLHARVWPYARALVHAARKQGITIKVISGTRTYAEQDALYAQGRTAPGKVVTRARAGFSNHNFGIAFDVGVFDGTAYAPESPRYAVVGALGRTLGLEWGGDWKSLVDEPHFQLRPAWAAGMKESAMLAELRARLNDGRDFFA